MTAMILAYTLICASVVLVRTLCVLDHMTHRTRWTVQVLYAVECAGAVGIASQAMTGDIPQFSSCVLLAGLVLRNIYDWRIYPPRLLRSRIYGRHRANADEAGS